MTEYKGIISACIAGVYTVHLTDGTVVDAVAKGNFRKLKIAPQAGDRVTLSLSDAENDTYLITAVGDRDNYLLRPSVSNVTILCIVVSASVPLADLYLVDTLIYQCINAGIQPILCINKCDTDIKVANNIAEQYTNSKVQTYIVSAVTGEGIESLFLELHGGIICFCGQSAVGKSSIINRLLPNRNLEVGGLSKKTNRGKHTTRQSELFILDKDTFICDTPGFSLLEDLAITPEELELLYYDFDKYREHCKYRGCSHTSEPNCAVKTAVQIGELSSERYQRYTNIYNTIKENWRNRYD